MQRSSFAACTILLLTLSTDVSASYLSSPSVEETIDAYDNGCATIETFDVRANVHSHPLIQSRRAEAGNSPVVPDGVSEITRQRFLGGSFRVDAIERNGQAIVEEGHSLVWDGAMGMASDKLRNVGSIDQNCKGEGNFGGPSFLQLYRGLSASYTFSQLFRDRIATVSAMVDGETLVLSVAPIDNRDAKGPFKPFSNLGAHLYLAPSKNFMPERITLEVLRGDKALLWSEYVNTLSEVSPGLWCPSRSQYNVYNIDARSEHFGKRTGETTIELDLAKSHFNLEITQSVFRLSFPVGMEVWDNVRNTVFIVGAETQQKFLDDLASHGRVSAERLKIHEPRMRRTFFPSQGRFWFIAVAVALIMSLGTLTAVKVLRSK